MLPGVVELLGQLGDGRLQPVGLGPGGVLALLQVGRQVARDAGAGAVAGPVHHAAGTVVEGRQVGVAVRVRRRVMLAVIAQ